MSTTIREKGYHRWEGELGETQFRWLPMFYYGIRQVIKRRFVKALLGFGTLVFLFFMGGIYVSTQPALKMFTQMVKTLSNEGMYFNNYYSNGFVLFVLLLLGMFFGADLISADIKFKSFPLYFSRPLDRRDYIVGKYSVILFYYLTFTLGTGLVMFLFKVIMTGILPSNPYFYLGLIFTPIFTSFFMAALVLGISSISGNSLLVRVSIVFVYFFTSAAAGILKAIFKSDYSFLVGIPFTLEQMGAFLFNIEAEFKYPAWISLAVVFVVSLGFFFLLYRRIGKLEAQLETGN